jgi:hypothetical protein
MQNPFMIQTPDLVENYNRGLEIGNAQQDRQRMLDQEQAAKDQQMQFQQDMYSVYSNPAAGSREYGALMMKYPSMAENIKKSWDVVSPDQQSTLASDMTQVYSALQNGRDDFAIQLLQEKAGAARNSGDEEGAQKFEMMVETGKADPMLLKDSTGMTLFAIKGKDYLEGLQKAPYGEVEAESSAIKSQAESAKAKAEAYIKGEEAVNAPTKFGLENQEAGANIKNIENQIEDRAVKNEIELRKTLIEEKKAAIDAAKANGVELDKDSRAFINEKAGDASFKTNNANRAASLSAKVDSLLGKEGGGTYQTIEQAAGNIAGWKDEEDAIRAEVQRIMTPVAMSSYKKFTSGATSDRDIETAMGGYPKPTDPPEVLASFLRGMDKMQRYDANLDKAMVGWASNVGSLADAPKNFEYKGIPVPKGTSYSEFEQMYIDKMVGDGANDSGKKTSTLPASLKGKSYAQGGW